MGGSESCILNRARVRVVRSHLPTKCLSSSSPEGGGGASDVLCFLIYVNDVNLSSWFEKKIYGFYIL